MKRFNVLFDKEWKISLWIFSFSFIYYFAYFPEVFLNLNSILSSITGDSLKNYFTYVYHIKNDKALLHFQGMNFPYGEHIIYTDCQPLITFLARLVPFLNDYSIGILHALIFLSMIVTPMIYHKIFSRLSVDVVPAILISFAISILTPQFIKLHSGHYALIYACIFPLILLLTLKYLQERTVKSVWLLFVYNVLLFLVHPYLALGTCLISLLALLSYLPYRDEKKLRIAFHAFLTSVIPIVLFKIFMSLTDKHLDRPSQPEGLEELNANLGSLVLPNFGPFRETLIQTFKTDLPSSEGYAYLGLFLIILSFLFILAAPLIVRKHTVKKETLALLIAAIVILFFAFGVHLYILNRFNIQSAALNQFRATGRYAWIFYYTWPVFVFVTLFYFMKTRFGEKRKWIFTAITGAYLLLNLVEANALYTLDSAAFWKFRNFFSEKQLNEDERKVLQDIEKMDAQAIVPLPVFHSGSEVINRGEYDNSMIPAFIYSYHSGMPVLSVLMSRTSMSESENSIQLLNQYKKEKEAVTHLNGKAIVLLKANYSLVPDEERLWKKSRPLFKNDSLEINWLSQQEFLQRRMENKVLYFNYEQHVNDTSGVYFLRSEDRKPFQTTSLADYETICTLDSTFFKPGNYVVSLRYYPSEKTYKGISCHLIIAKGKEQIGNWIYNGGTRKLNGFYGEFGVFEDKFTVEAGYRYQFFLKGLSDKPYRISDFLLRPEGTDVVFINGTDSIFNNFPD